MGVDSPRRQHLHPGPPPRAGAEPEELATTAAATIRHAPAIAFGDVVGANVTICLVGLGVGALVTPFPSGDGCWVRAGRPWSSARRGISDAVVAGMVGGYAYNATTTLIAAGLGAVAIGLFVAGPLAAVVEGIILVAVIRPRRDRKARSPDPTHLAPHDVVGRAEPAPAAPKRPSASLGAL